MPQDSYLTIVVPGVERLVVVFPATLETGVISVGNVVVAEYRVVPEWVIECHGEIDGKRRIKALQLGVKLTYEYT